MRDDARFDPRFDPAFQPGYDGPLSSAKPAVAPRPTVAAPDALAAVQPAAAQEPAVEDEPAPRRANPFLIALGALAVLLIVGGVYLVSRLRDLFATTQSSPEFDYVTLQVLVYAAPMIIVLGLATGIGVLFVLAGRRDRR
ncbi:hypothetical protein BH09ACT5_BH09ACT5_17370 [soil metagenome]